MELYILAIIATIVFVLIAIFLIPMLLQIRQTVQRVDEFINLAQRDVLPLIRDMREMMEAMKEISYETENDLKKIRPVFDTLQEAGTMVHSLTTAMNSGVGKALGRSVGTWLGMRAAKRAFKRELSQTKRR